jgi:hypothetical protein
MSVTEIVEHLSARRNGQGWQAKCPAHQDHEPSLSIKEGPDGRTLLHCHAGCSTDSVLSSLGLKHRDLFPADSSRFSLITPYKDVRSEKPRENGSDNGEKPHAACFDWETCVAAFTRIDCEKLSSSRGYSPDFCSWLHSQKLVGLCEGCVAFPVHDRAENVVGAHCRSEDGSWFYSPKGTKAAPLVVGELIAGERVLVFESQWDAFDFIDKSGERDGIIITRGASNGAFVSAIIPEGSTVYMFTQNDPPAEKWQKVICTSIKAKVKRVTIPAPYKDLNDWLRAGATTDDLLTAVVHAQVVQEPPRPLIEFRTPSELKNYVPAPGIMLVGDCHIVRGSVFVIGGAPGVGKSRASVALAIAGATGDAWFGLTVHLKFKTMIIQTENGLFRLKKEFDELNCNALEDYVRICEPPPFGLCFGRDEFKTQLSGAISSFAPDVVIFDPWNAAARDEKARQYLDTFDELRSVLPLGENAPALGIVAHTRKPKADERASGRALLNLLAGSYVLGSVPRTVFVIQAASDDTTDNRIVWTCCKNNDGELGRRSAWERRNGLFAPVADFDWETFNVPDDGREAISKVDIAAIFENGAPTRPEAVKALMDRTGASRASCYRALKPGERFAKQLHSENGKLRWLS